MKRFLEVAGFVLLVQGAGGLLHEWTGWFGTWSVLHRAGFLAGHEIFAGVVVAVLGAALLVASDSARE